LRWFFVAQGGQQRETENQPKKLPIFLLRDSIDAATHIIRRTAAEGAANSNLRLKAPENPAKAEPPGEKGLFHHAKKQASPAATCPREPVRCGGNGAQAVSA
jgi:hypothetical protein